MSELPQLKLSFHGQVIDHLGIQMYQHPVDAIAEMVSNAWDADASIVEITLPDKFDSGAEIVVKDNGSGMTVDECNDCYLMVGRNRRKDDPEKRTAIKKRLLLGRKGIGKFAGFGIAKILEIETTSSTTGEKTVFTLNLDEVRGDVYMADKLPIPVLQYLPADNDRRKSAGTTIRLKSLNFSRKPIDFSSRLARRFLLVRDTPDFKVLVNDEELSPDDSSPEIEYIFPAAYTDEERPKELTIDDNGYGVETLENGELIKWKVEFYRDTIGEEDMRGISVFSHGKLAQTPFFFNLSGGLSGQHGQQYASGHVIADYIDEQSEDLISTDRQQISWETEEARPLLEWGQTRIKELLSLWKAKRSEERIRAIEDRISGFSGRLNKLPRSERETVKKAIRKLAQIETLSFSKYQELGTSVLEAWESGRLRELIEKMSNVEEMSDEALVSLLTEAQILTALNTAEAVKTKVKVVAGLRKRIADQDLENAVRDYIEQNPWLIAPQWESFKKETKVTSVIEKAKKEVKEDSSDDYKGRVDLVLSSGNQLLILEFMKPGLKLDWDHMNRFTRYIRILRRDIIANTGYGYNSVIGYVVADDISSDGALKDEIFSATTDHMYAMDWNALLANAESQWQEFLSILIGRNPDDERLKLLLGDS